MTSTSSIEKSTLPSPLFLVTQGISLVSVVSTFFASPTISIIVFILSMQLISTRTVDTKPQLSTIFFSKGKEKEEEIDLDEEIVSLNWDISNLNPNQMHIFGELILKKAK